MFRYLVSLVQVTLQLKSVIVHFRTEFAVKGFLLVATLDSLMPLKIDLAIVRFAAVLTNEIRPATVRRRSAPLHTDLHRGPERGPARPLNFSFPNVSSWNIKDNYF